MARAAIVNTGAHTSVLPFTVWREADVMILGDHSVRGLVPREECVLEVKVARLTGVIVDGKGHTTDEITFRAFLAPTDQIPIVLGFKDLLEKFEVSFDFAKRSAYIESE